MHELMSASMSQLEREAAASMEREMSHRRVWLWGAPKRRRNPVSMMTVDIESEQPIVRVDRIETSPISRTRAVLNLIRLSIE